MAQSIEYSFVGTLRNISLTEGLGEAQCKYPVTREQAPQRLEDSYGEMIDTLSTYQLKRPKLLKEIASNTLKEIKEVETILLKQFEAIGDKHSETFEGMVRQNDFITCVRHYIEISKRHLKMFISRKYGFVQSLDKRNRTIVKEIKYSEKKPSYTVYAMALNIKGITISKKGVGITTGTDYVKLFGLKPGLTLYNKLNALQNDKIAEPDSHKKKAEEIIKTYNL